MKLPITIISMLALSYALTLTPRAAEGDPVVECGDLDVMTVDPLTSPRASPLATSGASLAPFDAVDASFYNSTVDTDTSPVEARSDGLGALRERACYKDAPYGCSGGYYWKACGNTNKGEWCWTAAKAGLGAWIKCSLDINALARHVRNVHKALGLKTVASHLFDCQARIPKMSFYTLLPSPRSIDAPFQESIKSLVRVVGSGEYKDKYMSKAPLLVSTFA
ncbi:hypothetical protein PENANT_c007G03076 [Penicillium antarcticum]|uniref:Uncharacterized protein n=1 Tax=Penicillium antarcticum TaxID=416450 RepID=A0A1V6QB83_9EURO|nr:hypothetical protein PENANT_c007G03076 [Penicillium antarcticum]